MQDKLRIIQMLKYSGVLSISLSLYLLGYGGIAQSATVDQLVDEMSQRIATITLEQTHDGRIPRFNQSKTVACVDANFEVHDDIAAQLKQGIFANATNYPARLRFANASEQDDSEKDIRGLSIRLSNIQGDVLWGVPGTQDFLFNSYPALFVDTPESFLDFIRARQEEKEWLFFLNPLNTHLSSLWTVFKARKKHLSPLDIRYWSTVPFALGEDNATAVKYSMTPCSSYQTQAAVNPGPNQLRSAIKQHLQQGEACFDFGVQLQRDAQTMPIEDASVIWDEEISPFQTVATIRFNNQDIESTTALASCEKSQFNPWQSLAAHKPLGKMNEVRRKIYEHAAKLRNKE